MPPAPGNWVRHTGRLPGLASHVGRYRVALSSRLDGLGSIARYVPFRSTFRSGSICPSWTDTHNRSAFTNDVAANGRRSRPPGRLFLAAAAGFKITA